MKEKSLLKTSWRREGGGVNCCIEGQAYVQRRQRAGVLKAGFYVCFVQGLFPKKQYIKSHAKTWAGLSILYSIYEQKSNDSIYVGKGLFQLTEMTFTMPCRHIKSSGVSCCFRQKSYYTRVHYSCLQEKSPVCQTLRQGPGFFLNF